MSDELQRVLQIINVSIPSTIIRCNDQLDFLIAGSMSDAGEGLNGRLCSREVERTSGYTPDDQVNTGCIIVVVGSAADRELMGWECKILIVCCIIIVRVKSDSIKGN